MIVGRQDGPEDEPSQSPGADLRVGFDHDAELYDRARPAYPDALLDDLFELSGLGPRPRILEVGAGTGQATLPLAARGASVLAVELGPSLAAVLRRGAAGLPIDVVTGAFEDCVLPDEQFDAVAAFTAWHWLTPDVRLLRAHTALRPGGSLVTVTTTHVRGGTVQFFDDVQECYERWDPATPPGVRTVLSDAIPAAVDEADTSALFGAGVRRRHHQDITYSTSAYLDVLGTYSGHMALAPEPRAGLFACVARLIDDRYDGAVTKRYLYELRVAPKRRG